MNARERDISVSREDVKRIQAGEAFDIHQHGFVMFHADVQAGEDEGEYIGEHTEDISYKFS